MRLPSDIQPAGLHGAHTPLQKVAAAISWWVDTAGKAWNKISKTAKLDQHGFLAGLPCHLQATREQHLKSLTPFAVGGLHREDAASTKPQFPPPASLPAIPNKPGRSCLRSCSSFLEISPLQNCNAASFPHVDFSPHYLAKNTKMPHSFSSGALCLRVKKERGHRRQLPRVPYERGQGNEKWQCRARQINSWPLTCLNTWSQRERRLTTKSWKYHPLPSPLLLLAIHRYLFLAAADEAFLFLATYTPFFALYNLIDLLLVNTKQNLFWVLGAPMHIKKL